MRKRTKYRFRTSISREGYESYEIIRTCYISAKEAKKSGHSLIAFKEMEVSVSEFLMYAVHGHIFCDLYRFDENLKYPFQSTSYYQDDWNLLQTLSSQNDVDPFETLYASNLRKNKEHTIHYDAYPVYKRGVNKGYFKIQAKSNQFFYGSQTVFVSVDIDKTKYTSLEEYVTRLPKKPTCAFYSYSDMKEEDGVASHRFTLVYVFNSVLNSEEYENMTYRIYAMIEREMGEAVSDMRVRRSQSVVGGDNPNTYNSSIIYSKDDFPTDNILVNASTPNHITVSQPEVAGEPDEIHFSDDLVFDMQNLPFSNVDRKWKDMGMEYIVRTPIDFGNDEYKIVDDDYVELIYSRKKFTDGQQRRKKLFVRAALRRLIKPNITADELLYNLFIDRELFFDNSDYELSVHVLKNIVEAAFRTDIGIIKDINARSERPTFVVNPNVPNKHKAVSAARRDITNRYIAKMYDPKATITDNLKIMNQGGNKIKKTRLYEWCKKNNITPIKRPVVDGYNPKLSIRKNAEVMGCTTSQIRKAKEAYMGKLASAPVVSVAVAEDNASVAVDVATDSGCKDGAVDA